MKMIYFDIVGGMAGDMTVASLLELGAPLEHLREGLATLGLEGLTIGSETAFRHKIAGTRFLVSGPGQNSAQEPNQRAGQGTGSSGGDAQGHGHRSYRAVRAIVENGGLSPGARETALHIFAKLAEAEGEVHGIATEEVTFHEVGAWDSIADIVCTALALDFLAPGEILCSPVPVGGGAVKTAHGVMPVPAPATLLLLRGFPVVRGGAAYERTTPTGAAILAAMARPAPQPFHFTPERVGVGCGTYDGPEIPNLLRAVWGSSGDGDGLETIECAEANLDDANPEWIGHLVDLLQAAGALDVVLIPVHMKKNRPGTLLQVLYPPGLRDTVTGLIFAESTTLGVRYRTMERKVLPREIARVQTPWGEVAGKIARIGERERFSPEFESCRLIASQAKVPLQEVYRAAQWAFQAQREGAAFTLWPREGGP